MGSFGERMRREREMRGITLEEIAESTKIGTRSLRALEEEDFGRLPGGIFNKGFVRSYARYLGIDEDQAISDFTAAYEKSRSEPLLPDVLPPEETPRRDLPVRALIMAGLLLLAVGVGIWRLPSDLPAAYAAVKDRAGSWLGRAESVAPAQSAASGQKSPPAPTPNHTVKPEETSNAPASAPQPVEKPSTAPAEAKPEARSDFEVQIRARQDTWVSVSADGKLLLEGVLNASTERTLNARNQMVLKTGNAAGVELSHNGRPVPPLGAEHQVKTVVFTPEGIQQ
jgi:cytoskeleton protein RodZ